MFCKPLYSFRLHYTTGLRKLNTFRFIPATFVSATCSPFAASVRLACWSPPAAGLSWFLCLPICLQLIFSGIQAKNKNTRQPLAVNSSHPPPSFFGSLSLPPVAPLAGGSRCLSIVRNPFRFRFTHCSQCPAEKAQGCITCLRI